MRPDRRHMNRIPAARANRKRENSIRRGAPRAPPRVHPPHLMTRMRERKLHIRAGGWYSFSTRKQMSAIATRSPGRNSAETTRRPLIQVPLLLPRSCTNSAPSTSVRLQCHRDTRGESTRESQRGWRPTTTDTRPTRMSALPAHETSRRAIKSGPDPVTPGEISAGILIADVVRRAAHRLDRNSHPRSDKTVRMPAGASSTRSSRIDLAWTTG